MRRPVPAAERVRVTPDFAGLSAQNRAVAGAQLAAFSGSGLLLTPGERALWLSRCLIAARAAYYERPNNVPPAVACELIGADVRAVMASAVVIAQVSTGRRADYWSGPMTLMPPWDDGGEGGDDE